MTEVLWQALPGRSSSLMVSSWPQMRSEDDSRELLRPVSLASIDSFQSLQSVCRAVRNARTEYNVEAGKCSGHIRTVNDDF